MRTAKNEDRLREERSISWKSSRLFALPDSRESILNALERNCKEGVFCNIEHLRSR
jgi:hypothetical protein